MNSVIQSLNELEKLKLLLFDQDQYFIFEHIPKPFLIDPNGMPEIKKHKKYQKYLDFDTNPKAICINCYRQMDMHANLSTEYDDMMTSSEIKNYEKKQENFMCGDQVKKYIQKIVIINHRRMKQEQTLVNVRDTLQSWVSELSSCLKRKKSLCREMIFGRNEYQQKTK